MLKLINAAKIILVIIQALLWQVVAVPEIFAALIRGHNNAAEVKNYAFQMVLVVQ
jgi:hypothetical protein